MRAPAHPHVFFDPTGRRWRRLKLLLVLVLTLAVIGGIVSWQRVREAPALDEAGKPPPPVLVADAPADPPVIGTGPLVRAVRVERAPDGTPVAVDPLTGAELRPITGDDAAALRGSRYAIDRYGYSAAAHRTISLTFDDGPDPVWTPKILDVLHRHGVPATFFVTGEQSVRHPEIVDRLVDEGHAIGNHTFSHPWLTPENAHQELVTTDRIIRSTTGTATTLFRMPYDGDRSGSLGSEGINAMLEAQRLGYLISLDDFDTTDWRYGDRRTRPADPIPLPSTHMDNITVLLHDGGGNRAETVRYLERIIDWGRANGYTFHTLPQVSEEVLDGTARQAPTVWDHQAYYAFRAVWFWPQNALHALFLLAVLSVAVGGLVNVALAVARRVRHRKRFADLPEDFEGPPVSVVIAAYNEEAVIAKTLASLGRTRYRSVIEWIVVDDGSTDGTAAVVAGMAAKDPRIRLVRQPNAGKAAALNNGFRLARGQVVVTLDADTVFEPDTVGNLVRHFLVDGDGRLGAVCGVVRVGNLGNVLSRWQALDYVTQLGVERGAQDLLGAILVVPGACAAWRRRAVLLVGGYSSATLTEDCDMAITLQKYGYRVVQDDRAASRTEVPETARALMRQRFRWLYGNIQVIWKHRRMILNPMHGWLGMLTLPAAVMSVVVPVVFLPLVYVMAFITLRGHGVSLILIYGGLFLAVQFVMAAVGVRLMRERPAHLLMVPLYRVIYEPLRAYLLYKAAYSALSGTRHEWQKLERTGAVALHVADEPMEVAS
ncbi:MAG TPA: bifunctional polysaccharide deacetylase/glycosyltransferase family 2 protein [Acidimicrobiales bacterium]